MRGEYVREYRRLFENHWWWRAREVLILSTLRAQVPPQSDRAILDVGCGDGLFFNRLAEFGHVEGVEQDGRMVSDDGPHRQNIHVGSFDEGFQPGKRYSLILMLDLLEHLLDPLAGVERARDLLTCDGLILITVPAFLALWTAHDELNHHQTRYTKRTLTELLRQAKLRIYHRRYFFHWTYPVKLAVRAKEGLIHAPPRPPRVPPAVVNRALFGISRLEQILFSRLPLPFGSSLLLLAGKSPVPPLPREVSDG